MSKIDEYGYCYSPFIVTSHSMETFIVVCFILEVVNVHLKLAEYIDNPLFELVNEKRKLLWIWVIAYAIYNFVYLLTVITYAVYQPNDLWLGYVDDGISPVNIFLWFLF